MQKVLERDAALTRLQKRLAYGLELTNEKLTREDKILKSETFKMTLKPGAGGVYGAVVSTAQKDDEKKEEREMTEAEKGDARKARSRMKEMDLGKLAPRFNIVLKGSEKADGIDCWVLGFTPKKGQPFNSREEKVINQLQGSFWVAKSDYSIIHSSGSLAAPVEVAWFVATMESLDFDYRTLALGDGSRMPARFYLLFDVSVPMSYVRRRQTSVMSDYVRVPKPEKTVKAEAAPVP